jgi:hypothetical protein
MLLLALVRTAIIMMTGREKRKRFQNIFSVEVLSLPQASLKSRLDVMALLNTSVEVDLVPDVEGGGGRFG